MIHVPSEEVEKREQENPDDIDEVPVEAAHFDGVVILRREPSRACSHRKEPKQANPDQEMEGMDSGHGEIAQEEQLGVPRISSLKAEARPRDQSLAVLQ